MTWLVVATGYVFGSIPTAFLAGRWLLGKDIRKLGDGNSGARNAFFQISPKAGVWVFIIDVAKGAIPVLLARAAALPDVAVLATGLAAVVGHNWPAVVGFRGGRGEATTIGVFLTVITQPMLVLAAPVLATLYFRKNVLITSCVLFIPLPFLTWWFGLPGMMVGYSVALPVLIAITHYFRRRGGPEVVAAELPGGTC